MAFRHFNFENPSSGSKVRYFQLKCINFTSEKLTFGKKHEEDSGKKFI